MKSQATINKIKHAIKELQKAYRYYSYMIDTTTVEHRRNLIMKDWFNVLVQWEQSTGLDSKIILK